jgi:WD40 repeat protein
MSAAINALDVCVWKPLVVTCGRDHTVRVWNYRDQTVILTKNFPDEPLSVALHPSGLIAVVGFADHLRVLSILMDDMRTIKEIPVRGCRLCAFSHGGQAFAVATSSLVQIYDTYTGAMKLQLRGHQQAVRSVAWSDRDRRLLTVGKDGNLFLWDARTGARLKESLQPRTCFDVTALAGDAAAPASRVFAHATDMTIKAFASATLTPENQVPIPSFACYNRLFAHPCGEALTVLRIRLPSSDACGHFSRYLARWKSAAWWRPRTGGPCSWGPTRRSSRARWWPWS